VHKVEPVALSYQPSAQLEQELDLILENFPVEQLVQLDSPVEDVYLPAVHSVQELAPEEEYVPGAHELQLVEPMLA